MSLRRAASKPDNHSASIHIPIRRTQSDKCRHKVNAARILDFLSDPFGIGSTVDHADAVAQPLNRRTRYENRTFKRVFDFAVEPPSNRRYKPVFRFVNLGAGVHEHETARAISILRGAGLEAILPEQGRLLVTGRASYRNRRSQNQRRSLAVNKRRRLDFGQNRFGHVEIF